jgi:hypothetical protein
MWNKWLNIFGPLIFSPLKAKSLLYMEIAIVTWYILILWSMYGCVQNIFAYEFKIIHVVQKFQYFT